MKNKFLTTVSIIFLSTFIYAGVPSPNLSTPAPDYNTYFGTQDISSSTGTPRVKNQPSNSKNLIGENTFPRKEITGATKYSSEFGHRTDSVEIDNKGTQRITDLETNTTTKYFFGKQQSKQYINARQAYRLSVENNESIKVQREKLLQAKIARKNETFRQGFDLKNYSETLLKNVNPAAKGRSFVNKRFLTIDQNASQADQNSTNFYKSNFSILPEHANVSQITDTKVGKLKEAYNLVKSYEKLAKSKLNSGTISCYISRELLPAYYCPFADMTETKYPDFNNPNGDPMKVSSAKAQEMCNGVCHKTRKCLPYKVLKNTTYEPKFKNIDIYPWSQKATNITINTKDTMQVKEIEFDVVITPSKNFDGNKTAFNNYLLHLGKPIRYRTTISARQPGVTEGSIKKIILFQREITYIKGSLIHKEYRILTTAKNFYLKFYEPFVYDGYTPEDIQKNEEIMKNISSIKVKNIKVIYTSNNIYFCPFKQLVNKDSQCPNGTILDLSTNSAVYHVCINNSHRIGPDPKTGGFYTQKNCQYSCIEHRKCKVTYAHYANMAINNLYKAKVGCVDNGHNSGCSEQLCESYFADGNKRPINEIVVQRDNKRVYTVKNKILTGIMRPKINYNAEINSLNPNYHDTFETEMKDAAYKNMVSNQTLNKIRYLIGTPSPLKQAYNSTTINGAKNLVVIIKPRADQFDNGKTYHLYSVIKFEQTYRPAYGIFIINNNYVNATTQPIVFKDIEFMIKKHNGTWKIFKVINFAKVRKEKVMLYCKSADGTTTGTVYRQGQNVPSNCNKQTEVYWSNIPAYSQERNVFYNPASDTFENYGTNEIAASYLSKQWNSNLVENRFRITNDLYSTIENTPGAVIHSQVEKDNGASFARRYNTPFNMKQRGYIANVWLYSFYSENSLTYNDIIKNYLTPEYTVWELANQMDYPTKITQDGEINNNIRAFLVGAPSKSTLDVDIKPKFTEEGKRVFKFVFLYDPTKDPFANINFSKTKTNPTN